MNILITGVTGFVGSNLARRLVENPDYKVYGLARYNSEGIRRLEKLGLYNYNNFHLIRGDLTDEHSIAKAFNRVKPDIVFHLGAQSHVGFSFKAPLITYQTNVIGTLSVAENCVKHNCKLIFAGSSEEYGLQFFNYTQWDQYGRPLPEPQDTPEFPIKETNPLRPVSPYAVSKVNAEQIIETYSRIYDMNYTILRVFNTEGAGRGKEFITKTIARQMLMVKQGLLKDIRLGNVNTMRDMVHIDDTVEAYIKAIDLPRDVFNVASGIAHSIIKLAMLFYKYLYVADPIAEIYRKEISPRKLVGAYNIEEIDREIVTAYTRMKPLVKPGYKILLTGGEQDITITIDKERWRPADIYILLGDNTKLRRYVWSPKKTITNVIVDIISEIEEEMKI